MASAQAAQSPRRRWITLVVWAVAALPFWLAMMTVHEAGHALHAWFSGGQVREITIPFPGFSQTVVDPNPRPLLVAMGGPLWGVLLPMLAALGWWSARVVGWHWAAGFAGFCLIANGAYLGIGAWDDVGDAGELQRRGVPRWVVSAIGIALLAAGLWLWHRLGRQRGSADCSTIFDTVGSIRGNP